MRKAQKNILLEFIQTLYQAHAQIKDMINKKNIAQAAELLEQCQKGAIHLGSLIEQSEGEGFVTIGLLEEYCEVVYHIYENIGESKTKNGSKVYKLLHKQLIQIENSVKNDIKQKIEVVFLPYNASMWDSMESVWKAADEAEGCDAYVIPIPYYSRNPDGSFKEEYWEGDRYPDYVPITGYDTYKFGERHPDMIFIHNPYDDLNSVTSVHPFFYSKNLQQYTEKLIYIPYFILNEISPDDQQAIGGMQHFCTVPGVINSDKVIVQSEDMRQIYLNVLTEISGEDTRRYWENKILGLGSPKVDKVLDTEKLDLQIPLEWLKIIQKVDGSWKKIVFYNTSIGALLQNDEKMIKKMKEVFKTFKQNRDDVALLWRPHPLVKTTIKSMRPQLWKDYQDLIEEYQEEGWGIYDDSTDIDRAVVISDAYYGDLSSAVQLCQKMGKTVMIQNVYSLEENNYSLAMDNIVNYQGEWWFLALKDNGIYRMNKDTLEASMVARIPCDEEVTNQQYSKIYIYKDKIFVIPWGAKKVAIYDIQKNEFRYLEYDAEEVYRGVIFLKGVVRENKLYLIPCAFNKLLYIDMNNEEICVVDESLSSVFPCSSISHRFAWGNAFDEEDSVIFTKLEENKIIRINLRTAKKETFESNLLNLGGAGVCGDDQGIWVVPHKADLIIYWDRYTKQVCTYTDFPEGYQSGELSFYKIYLDNGVLYMLPRDANMFISVDREGHMINVIPEEENTDNNHSLDRYMRYSDVWKHGDKIFFISSKRGELYTFKGNGELKKKEIKIVDKEKRLLDINNFSVIAEKENRFEGVEQYLDAVKKSDNVNIEGVNNININYGKVIFKCLLNGLIE
jgi:hypothetical protein